VLWPCEQPSQPGPVPRRQPAANGKSDTVTRLAVELQATRQPAAGQKMMKKL